MSDQGLFDEVSSPATPVSPLPKSSPATPGPLPALNAPALPPHSPRTLSPSAMFCYRSCPRKWQYRYIQKLPDPPGYAAVLGSFVHEVLEDLMRRLPAERTVAQARHIAKEVFATTQHTPDFQRLKIADAATQSKFKRQAWDSICTLWELEQPGEVTVKEVEMKVKANIAGVPFFGIVDRVDDSPKGLIVTDYKSGKPNKPARNYSTNDNTNDNTKAGGPTKQYLGDSHIMQVLLYCAGLLEQYGQLPTEARLLYLGEHKLTTSVEVAQDQISEATGELSATWNEITADCASGNFKARTSPLCAWCPYLAFCEEGQAKTRQLAEAGRLRQDAPAWNVKESWQA